MHELKRLARNAAALMTFPVRRQTSGVQLGLLTGPLRVLAVSMTISRQCAAASAPGRAWCSRARAGTRA